MLPTQFVLTNVDVWNPDGVLAKKDVWVEGGRIQRIEATGTKAVPEGAAHLNGEGQALLPAGLDLQVHLRVPGQPEKETPETGLRAALRGGFGAVLTMPNTQPVIDRPEIVERARRDL